MVHLITLSRLARLVGLPRSALQRMAQAGELATFDGHVDVAEVLRAFPDAKFENDSEIRRVEQIKDAALNKTADRFDLPGADVLVGRLTKLGQDYARLEAQLRHQERVHGWLADKLVSLVQDGRLAPDMSIALVQWFKRELATPPDDTERWQRLITRERLMRVMSAHVKVMPRDLVFEALGNETLLEAGLRAGLSFSYGCSNGNCGQCKARVVTGEVCKVRPHDFIISEADRAKGATLLCCYAAVGDVEIDAATATAGEIPAQSIEARVRAAEPLGPNVVAIHLLTPRSERLRFLAGQKIRARIAGMVAEFSIASCPCEERRVELHVPVNDASAFARHATHDLKTNDTVELTGPYGDFVLDEVSARALIFIAEGEGYPPIKSLIQHALSLDHASSIEFYWLAGSSGHYQENLPRSYASALDNFKYTPFGPGIGEAAALLSIAAQSGFVESDVYASGSTDFIERAQAAFLERGLLPERWHSEVTVVSKPNS